MGSTGDGLPLRSFKGNRLCLRKTSAISDAAFRLCRRRQTWSQKTSDLPALQCHKGTLQDIHEIHHASQEPSFQSPTLTLKITHPVLGWHRGWAPGRDLSPDISGLPFWSFNCRLHWRSVGGDSWALTFTAPITDITEEISQEGLHKIFVLECF